jgi:enterochelin esterase-like enzyme
MLIWLLGCTPAKEYAVESTETQPPSLLDIEADETTNAELAPVATELIQHRACQEDGRFERLSFLSQLMDGELEFSIYFPPCYDSGAQDVYPVIYLLHGQKQNDGFWERLGIGEAADTLIQSGVVMPFLMVMPYEQYYYRPVDNNNFPRALLEELLPWIEKNLPACEQRDCRAIGGISRGASWAIRLALIEWEYFSVVGAHSFPTFNGDLERLPDWLEDIPHDKVPSIYIDIGSSDPAAKKASNFEQILNEKGVPHEWHLNEGQHTEEYWRNQIAEYLRWYTSPWKLE